MSQRSKIEWTDATWNPWHGCHKVSPGCKFCYMFREKKQYGQDPNVVVRSKTTFNDPLRWKDPRFVFTCSWSDWFIEEADAWRNEAYDIIRRTPHLIYQILTKRIERASGMLPDPPLPNLWLGVSVEDQQRADERIPLLLETPAAVRWISAEPLLGPVDLSRYLEMLGQEFCQNCGDEARRFLKNSDIDWTAKGDGLCRECGAPRSATGYDPATGEFRLLDWIVVGGESGPGARPCDVAWIRSIKDQCQVAGVPCFVKQVGSRPFWRAEDGTDYPITNRNRKGGDPAEWPEDLRVRQMPEVSR